MLRNLPNPFHTAVFHFDIRVQTFGHRILNDDLLAFFEKVDELLFLGNGRVDFAAFFIQEIGDGGLFYFRRKKVLKEKKESLGIVFRSPLYKRFHSFFAIQVKIEVVQKGFVEIISLAPLQCKHLVIIPSKEDNPTVRGVSSTSKKQNTKSPFLDLLICIKLCRKFSFGIFHIPFNNSF